MSYINGILFAFCAAIAFGVQYAPVKKYDIFDGITFQWFMCSGILMTGFILSVIFGDFGMNDKQCLPIIAGGALWALANYSVLPLVKLLGIGLGFSLYHFVNLMVGYLVGRLGLFGMQRLESDNLLICDMGCGLILVSFVLMVFVESEEDQDIRKIRCTLPPPMFADVDPEYRDMYHRWRQGDSRGSRDPRVTAASPLDVIGEGRFGHPAAESTGHFNSVGGFSIMAAPRLHEEGSIRLQASAIQPDRQASAPPAHAASLSVSNGKDHPQGSPATLSPMPRGCSSPSLSAIVNHSSSSLLEDETPRSHQWRYASKVAGVGLALVGGAITGVQSVPATIYNQNHPRSPPTAVIFPQCLGIYVCSSFIYLLYGAIGYAYGWKVPHAAIRPPYLSGCIWAVGFACMILGISQLGFSVGYTLDAVGPIVVASLLSIFVFKEITRRKQLILYWAAFGLQLAGVVLMAAFAKHD